MSTHKNCMNRVDVRMDIEEVCYWYQTRLDKGEEVTPMALLIRLQDVVGFYNE